MTRQRFAILTAGVTLSVLAACGGDDMGNMGNMGDMHGGSAPEGSIEVRLTNWEVDPSRDSTEAGTTTFWAVHDMEHAHGMAEGGITHDLQVMRKLGDGALELVGQVQNLSMGESGQITLELEAGEYELSCNVVERIGGETISHYARGMHTEFTVN